MTAPPACPECKRSKWSTVQAKDDWRRQALRCMECGFEVDAAVFVQARRIRRRDHGQDQTATDLKVQGA